MMVKLVLIIRGIDNFALVSRRRASRVGVDVTGAFVVQDCVTVVHGAWSSSIGVGWLLVGWVMLVCNIALLGTGMVMLLLHSIGEIVGVLVGLGAAMVFTSVA